MHRTNINSADLLVAHARRQPDRVAIIAGDRKLSFSEFVSLSARSARQFASSGVMAGQHVGLALRDGVEFMASLFGLWMLDVVVVPLDFRLKPAERRLRAEEFDLNFIVEDRKIEYPETRPILVDDAWLDARLLQSDAPLSSGAAEAPATITLTSGTTGTPIGFVMQHHQLIARVAKDASGYFHPSRGVPNPADGCMIITMPLSTAGARNVALAYLLNGGGVKIAPPLTSAKELAAMCASDEVDALYCVPTMLRDLLDLAGNGPSPFLPGLKVIRSGGAPISVEEKLKVTKQLSPNYMEVYATAMTGVVSALIGEDIQHHGASVGRITTQMLVEIVDQNATAVPAGVVGELRVRGPSVIDHVYGGKDRLQGDRVRDGWVYTGDVGRIDEEQILTLVGRTGEMIIRGGSNVFPQEIEEVIKSLSGVTDVAVIGYPDDRAGEEIAAFVVAKPNVDESALRAHCIANLPSDKRPKRFMLIDALPVNVGGKVEKTTLANWL